MQRERQINHKRGFTLIEVLVVLAVVVMIYGLTSFISASNYRGSSFRGERDALVGALQRARAQAMNNICLDSLGGCSDGKKHGIHITNTDYTIFQGGVYSPSDPLNETTKFDYDVEISAGSFTDVVFSQLSGDATTLPAGAMVFTLTDSIDGRSSTITVNNYGQITWTN